MDHLKLHILVVRKLGLICSFAITRAYRHDSPILPRLMAALSIVEFILCGDAAYLSRLSCKMVSEKKGVKAWYKIVMLFMSIPWGYLLVCHLRAGIGIRGSETEIRPSGIFSYMVYAEA